MRGREDRHVADVAQALAGDRVKPGDALDVVAEHLDADRGLLVRGVDLDRVAPYPELAAGEVHVVALVAEFDEPAQDEALIVGGAADEPQDRARVLLGRAQAVDAGDRGDDDDVAAGKEGGGGAVP